MRWFHQFFHTQYREVTHYRSSRNGGLYPIEGVETWVICSCGKEWRDQ